MVFGITRQYIWCAIPFTGFFIGKFLDDMETDRMTRFRDKSALYGRQVDKPSWP